MPPANWWDHRFKQVSGPTTVYTFIVNHTATVVGEDARSPNDNVGYATIEQAESALGPLGLGTGSDWYIQRVGSNPLTCYYKIHHDATVASKCPTAPPGYSSIQYIVDNQCLSYFHANSACKPVRPALAESVAESASRKPMPKRTARKPKPKTTRTPKTKLRPKVRRRRK